MSRAYTLFGFTKEIDRRSLKFVEPVPPATICDSCGYVPRSTCSLPCGHTLCEPCCQRCTAATADGAEFECPFDGDVCSAEEVARRDCSGNLLRRTVHCWNEANGCTAVLPASEITKHFHHDCQHHVTRCPTCHRTVLWNDVCAHQKSQCTDLIFHAAAEAQPDTDEGVSLVATERKVRKQAVELDAKLAQLSLESGSKSDRLAELCRGASDLNKTLRGQFYAASAINDHRLECNAALIRATYMAKSDALMSAIVATSPAIQNDPETREWVLKGYTAHTEKAMRGGCSIEMTEKAYLHRYLMSWGVYFKRNVDTVCICLRHCLHKGRYDEFLSWPYAHEMKLIVIHPDTREECEIRVAPCTSNNAEAYCRPVEPRNKAMSYPFTSFPQDDIERGGFVKNDQLLLRFEVLL